MGSHLSFRLLPALIVDSYGCMNNKVKLSLFCPFKSSGISASLLASAASFLLFSESSLSPCHAIFASLPPFFSSAISLPCLLQAVRSKQTSDS